MPTSSAFPIFLSAAACSRDLSKLASALVGGGGGGQRGHLYLNLCRSTADLQLLIRNPLPNGEHRLGPGREVSGTGSLRRGMLRQLVVSTPESIIPRPPARGGRDPAENRHSGSTAPRIREPSPSRRVGRTRWTTDGCCCCGDIGGGGCVLITESVRD